MNHAQSSDNSGPLPRAMTLKFEPNPAGEAYTTYETRPNGTSLTVSHLLRLDGKDYPCDCAGSIITDTVASRRINVRTIEIMYRKSGRQAARIVRTITTDGNQMTLEIRIDRGQQPPLERKLAFEREAGR